MNCTVCVKEIQTMVFIYLLIWEKICKWKKHNFALLEQNISNVLKFFAPIEEASIKNSKTLKQLVSF